MLPRLLFLPLAALIVCSCSVKKLAIGTFADALAEGTAVYASDDDPQLVGQALPFALKTLEGLLESDPRNVDLLLSTCQGFTTYSYGFAELEAAWVEYADYDEFVFQRDRALRLYLRARDYCLRALESVHPGLPEALTRSPGTALQDTSIDDVPSLYWTAASWGATINLGLHRPDLVVDLPSVRALVERLLVLAPDYGEGSVQEAAMLLYALPEAMGGDYEKAVAHRDRAIELHGGRRASTYVAFASTVSVARQDRTQFRTMLQKALAIDTEAAPVHRLANVLGQRRAQQLLDHIDDLFLAPLEDDSEPGA
ncbi:MAG: TRAP transporter TatT component family protein [Thermoanaerobaculia bacterium]|nr:TRAP transporter TatT component family protein [Thermoanaerobaculia bacterium]